MKTTFCVVGCVAAATAFLVPLAAQAQALKCVDPSGKVTYADAKLPGQNCTAVQGSVNVVAVVRPFTSSQSLLAFLTLLTTFTLPLTVTFWVGTAPTAVQ